VLFEVSFMKSLIAVLSGCVVAIVAYWGGAVVAFVGMHGIPLGSAGGPPTANDISVHLALGCAASYLGARLAIRLGRTSPHLHAGAVGLLLAINAVAGFGKAASQWPPWFGVTMATASVVGAVAAVAWVFLRDRIRGRSNL
jgi:hypothetical protein